MGFSWCWIFSIIPERFRKFTVDRDGYLRVGLNKEGQQKQFGVHRLVVAAFIEGADLTLEVNHKDGDKQNNSLDNLELCTQEYNIKHAFSTGLRSSIGSRNNKAKLNEAQVRDIKKYLREGVKGSELCNKYKVSKYIISNIKLGKTWKHVK